MRHALAVFAAQACELLYYDLPPQQNTWNNLDISCVLHYAKRVGCTPAEFDAMDDGYLPLIEEYTKKFSATPAHRIKGWRMLWWRSRFAPQLITSPEINVIMYERLINLQPLAFDPSQPLIWWRGRVLQGYEVQTYTGKWP